MVGEADPARAALRAAKQEQMTAVAGLPSLHLLVWATRDGMRLSLVMYHSLPGARRSCTVLRDATWRPKEVSEVALVDWGRRALADWLEKPTQGHVRAGPWPLL
jgi:hypothetical protein